MSQSATSAPLGIIAGTGFYSLAALTNPQTLQVATPYGSAQVTTGGWHDIPVVFLTRHGAEHTVAPHLVNYRANIRALADLGVDEMLSVNAVGAIDPDLGTGSIICLDDFVDLTRGRIGTFVGGSETGAPGQPVVHTDMSAPYDAHLTREILDAAAGLGLAVRDGGVYACFDGPRFESRAEIRLAALAGAHVVGMTGVPEVTLAREAGLRYAAIALVVNPAAGVSDQPITMDDVNSALRDGSRTVLDLLDALLRRRAEAS